MMTISLSIGSYFEYQATKGIRWMPWRWKAMKDVASCDKPRLAASKLTRGFPNGTTQLAEGQLFLDE